MKFGSVHLFNGGVEHQATRTLFHEGFDSGSLANDIALASIFPARLTYGFTIQPVTLPDASMEVLQGTFLTIYGWGATSVSKPCFATMALRKVTFRQKKN